MAVYHLVDSEQWANLSEIGFPDYAVSNEGRVRSERTQRLLAQTCTPRGTRKVGLIRAKPHDRVTLMVSRLVAHSFVKGQTIIFNTPIHLDGDLGNNHYLNLMWRPRWFALKYHMQFSRDPIKKGPIYLVDTGEMFANPRAASVKYGLLELEVASDLATQRGVFPTGFLFKNV